MDWSMRVNTGKDEAVRVNMGIEGQSGGDYGNEWSSEV